MSDNIVHAIISTNTHGTRICLHLTKKFKVTLDEERRGVRVDQESVVDSDLKIGSIHTLFGENGAGKTHVLLELAHIFNPSSRKHTAAVLYENSHGVFLRPGKSLAGWTLEDGGFDVIFSSELPVAESVFYTTSPYEYGRRKFPRNARFRDITPTFGQRNSFDALALLTLPKQAEKDDKEESDFSFIERATIRWKLNLFTDHEAIQVLARSAQASRVRVTGLERNLRPLLTRLLSDAPHPEFRVIFSLWHAANALHERDGTSMWLDHLLDILPANPKPVVDPQFLLNMVSLMEQESGRLLGYERYDRLKSLMFDLLGSKKNHSGDLSRKEFERTFVPLLDQPNGDIRYLMHLNLLEFSLAKLSSGETAYLILLSALHGALTSLQASLESSGDRSAQHTPIFLLIDEGEMFLHPRWQRGYLSKLQDFIVKSYSRPKQVHLVVSTHSLIVAADSPPNSLVDIKSGKPANAFGLGPLSTLDEVYGVKTFYGNLALQQLERLESLVWSNSREMLTQAATLVENLADIEMREAIKDQIKFKLNSGQEVRK